MSIKRTNELNDLQKDSLKELGTMGAGQAAIALTEFLEKPIYMKVPLIQLVTVDSIPKILKKRFRSDKRLAITSASNTTELYYTVLVLFDQETVNEILRHKSPPEDDIETLMEFSTFFMSMIEEIGSIILIKYIFTLNHFLGLEGALPSQPQLRIGRLNSLMKNELKDFDKGSKVFFIDCDIYSEDEDHIKTECVLIPHIGTYDRFIRALFTQYL